MPRWLVATTVLLSVSVFINYIDRGNLATAAPLIKDEFHLSATQLGFLLTAFFVTYAPVQLGVGWLVDRYGPERILLTGFALWSAATAFTGLAQSFVALLVLRLLLGLGESVAFPCYAKILARWFPEDRRGRASAAIMACMALGPAFGTFAGGLLIAAYGWRPFFIGFGLVTFLWIVPWMRYAHRHLSHAREPDYTADGPTYGEIVRSRPLWGATAGQFCNNYVWYFVLSWIPYYLVHVRNRSIAEMATIAGIAYITMAVATFIFGAVGDRWIAAGGHPTLVRKTFLCAGSVLAAVGICGCVTSSTEYSIAFLIFAGFSSGMVSPNILAVPQTLAGPAAAGRWVGVQNAFANFAGIIAPALTGFIVDKTGSFTIPFFIAAALSLLAAFSWLVLVGPIKQVSWRRAPAKEILVPSHV
jgi:MFS family permease